VVDSVILTILYAEMTCHLHQILACLAGMCMSLFDLHCRKPRKLLCRRSPLSPVPLLSVPLLLAPLSSTPLSSTLLSSSRRRSPSTWILLCLFIGHRISSCHRRALATCIYRILYLSHLPSTVTCIYRMLYVSHAARVVFCIGHGLHLWHPTSSAFCICRI